MATKWYVEQCLEAGCAFVNCIPVFIGREEYWQRRFLAKGLPIIGDDIKSQVGATITHRNVITTMVDGKEKTTYSRSVHFLEKRSDRWQVVSNAGNPLGDSALLLYMEREWNDAELARDYAWHERNYSDDFSGISSRTGALSTKSEDIASSKKATVTSANLSDLDVRVEGDSAIVTGINHVMGTDDKGAFDRKVRFTDTFVKRDGRWLVWATQGTAIS